MNWVPEVDKEQEPTTDDMAYDILAMTYKKWAQLGEEQRPAEGEKPRRPVTRMVRNRVLVSKCFPLPHCQHPQNCTIANVKCLQ